MNNALGNVIISGHNLDLTDALKSAVQEKIEKLFEHEPNIMRVRVELINVQSTHNKKEFMAKGHIEIKGKPLIVSESSENLYKAIDDLADKLDRKLRRRSRLKVLKRKQPHGIDIPADLPKVRSA